MSDYYGNATLEDWLAKEVLDVEEVPAIVVVLFERWRIGIEDNILAWMASDDGYGNNLSWRGWGRGFNGIPDEESVEFAICVENAQKIMDILATDYISNFQHSATVNDLAGNANNGDWSDADHQMKIIASEFEELRDDGVAARNIEEVRDGIADVLFTVYGLAHRMGFNADSDYANMMESQWSKFDTTILDAQKTAEKYTDMGMATYFEKREGMNGSVFYVTFSAKDQKDHKGRDCPKGKWLKSHRFFEPVFAPLPTETLERLQCDVVDTVE